MFNFDSAERAFIFTHMHMAAGLSIKRNKFLALPQLRRRSPIKYFLSLWLHGTDRARECIAPSPAPRTTLIFIYAIARISAAALFVLQYSHSADDKTRRGQATCAPTVCLSAHSLIDLNAYWDFYWVRRLTTYWNYVLVLSDECCISLIFYKYQCYVFEIKLSLPWKIYQMIF